MELYSAYQKMILKHGLSNNSKINYSGGKAKLYFDHRLVADDFNDGTTWIIGLNRLGNGLENQLLKLDIFSLPSQPRVYFDDESAKQEGTVAKVKKSGLCLNISSISTSMAMN